MNKYKLYIDGVLIKEAEKIVYLKSEFYIAIVEGKNTWIEKNGKKIYFNGKKMLTK